MIPRTDSGSTRSAALILVKYLKFKPSRIKNTAVLKAIKRRNTKTISNIRTGIDLKNKEEKARLYSRRKPELGYPIITNSLKKGGEQSARQLLDDLNNRQEERDDNESNR